MPKPDFIEVTPEHWIATKGIMAIKQKGDGSIEVRYITGFSEHIEGVPMAQLLTSLGRDPRTQGRTDSP